MDAPEARSSTRRALVTGAAGFIGSHVADSCLALGMEVVATDDLSGGFIENVPREATWAEGDLKDVEFCGSLWELGPFDYVYHLGAYAAEGLSHFVRRFNYETNLVASINLINLAILHKVERFVFASSIAVYGAGQTPMSEELTPQPEDPYGVSKYAVELDLRAVQHMFDLEYTVFRPHNVYGERQNIADPYRNVIGIFMNAVMRGEPLPVFGDGRQTRAFSHIDDVAPLIARSPLMTGARNEVFNVGADVPYSILELAEEVSRAFDVPVNTKHLLARNEVVHAFSDQSKARRVFAPPEPIALSDGIARMAQWVREQGARPPVGFPGEIEVAEKLPPSWTESFSEPPHRTS
jgi:UDP-glucose 4-epimerase